MTKIDEYLYTDNNFNCIFNSRNRHGGGVAFIIKKEIDFCLINDLEKFNCECLCILIEINNEETHLITYYNSPTTDLNIEMLDYIHTLVPKKNRVFDMGMGKFTLTCTHYPLPEIFG